MTAITGGGGGREGGNRLSVSWESRVNLLYNGEGGDDFWIVGWIAMSQRTVLIIVAHRVLTAELNF